MLILIAAIIVGHPASGYTHELYSVGSLQTKIEEQKKIPELFDDYLWYVARNVDLNETFVLQQIFQDEYNWEYICTPNGSDEWSIKGVLSRPNFEIIESAELHFSRVDQRPEMREALGTVLIKRKKDFANSGFLPIMVTSFEYIDSWRFFIQKLPILPGKHTGYSVNKKTGSITVDGGRLVRLRMTTIEEGH